jgi:hypothetical protein
LYLLFIVFLSSFWNASTTRARVFALLTGVIPVARTAMGLVEQMEDNLWIYGFLTAL